MDNIVNNFVNNLVEKCLENPILAGKRQELEDYFYQQAVFTLIDNLNQEQFDAIKDLDPESQEALDKISQFASEIPGLVDIMDAKLGATAETIKTTGQIPQ